MAFQQPNRCLYKTQKIPLRYIRCITTFREVVNYFVGRGVAAPLPEPYWTTLISVRC